MRPLHHPVKNDHDLVLKQPCGSLSLQVWPIPISAPQLQFVVENTDRNWSVLGSDRFSYEPIIPKEVVREIGRT